MEPPSPAPGQTETKPQKIPVSFRLSQASFDKLHGRAAEAGVSGREWLDRAILENKTVIVAKAKRHPDLGPLLFQVNKAGNNLNQLAHRLNSLALAGKITATDATLALSALERISQTLQEALDRAR